MVLPQHKAEKKVDGVTKVLPPKFIDKLLLATVNRQHLNSSSEEIEMCFGVSFKTSKHGGLLQIVSRLTLVTLSVSYVAGCRNRTIDRTIDQKTSVSAYLLT